MAKREAENALGVVTGMISFCDHVAYVLFDPGASHSFVSDQFVRLTGMTPHLLDVMLCFTTSLNDKILKLFKLTLSTVIFHYELSTSAFPYSYVSRNFLLNELQVEDCK